jgi:putative transposase
VVHDISKQRACRLLNLQRSTFYKASTAKPQENLIQRIKELAAARPRFGYKRIHVLLQREGWPVGVKRVHRLYRLEGLALRRRTRKKRSKHKREVPPAAHAPNECWALDVVHDTLTGGRPFRVLTAMDICTREGLAVKMGFSTPASFVTHVLDEIIARRGVPKMLRIDNGTEFTSNHFDRWAWKHRIHLDYTTPGKPTENGHIESFNGRLRDEFLRLHQFESLSEAQKEADPWLIDYNEERPHSALENLAPVAYVARLLAEK